MAETMNSPKELVSIVRTQTLAIQNELVKAEGKDHSEPLKFYSNFSRFPIVIINQEKKATTANINVEDVTDMIARTTFAYNKDLEMTFQPKSIPVASANGDGEDLSQSPAFTVVLSSGMGLKGKTPGQLILENPSNTDRLNNQYKWLKDNLDKNPKFRDANQKQMDAIAEAGKLFKAGKLTAESAPSQEAAPVGLIIPLMESGMRPLTRRPKKDGNTFVYDIKVSWVVGNNYPVLVEIQNYYAPVTTKSDGMLNVQASKKTNSITNSMKLSAKDWMYVMHMLESSLRTFEDTNADWAYKTASDASYANRAAAGIENH